MNLLKNDNNKYVIVRTINTKLYTVEVSSTMSVEILYTYNELSNEKFIKLAKLFKEHGRNKSV